MAHRVYLVHWHEAEARERAKRIRDAGYVVSCGWQEGGQPAREIKKRPPRVVVIDLARLPSHGRQVAKWIRGSKSIQRLPILFMEGDPAKTDHVREEFPDCVVSTWSRLKSSLKKAIANPPKVEASKGKKAPADTGYSGTPLTKKLGIKPNSVLTLLGAPANFESTLGDLPEGVKLRKAARGSGDVLVLFAKSAKDLARRFPSAHRSLAEGGGLWVAWPKKASGVETDLSQPVVQRVGLDAGLVDNKICAIDETWSGQRFMRRRS